MRQLQRGVRVRRGVTQRCSEPVLRGHVRPGRLEHLCQLLRRLRLCRRVVVADADAVCSGAVQRQRGQQLPCLHRGMGVCRRGGCSGVSLWTVQHRRGIGLFQLQRGVRYRGPVVGPVNTQSRLVFYLSWLSLISVRV